MIIDTVSSGNNSAQVHSKKQWLLAVCLGLLTFIVTPLVSIAVGFIFLFLGEISESVYLITIISDWSGLQGLGGYFAVQFIIIGFFALTGNAATAIISWLIIRSKLLAGVTFISALAFQFIIIVMVIPNSVKRSYSYIEASVETEKAFQQFAKIGNISYQLQEPYSESEMNNPVPEYGPIYKRFVLQVPISVSRAGAYRLSAQYRFATQGLWGNTPMKAITRTFDINDHVVQIEFSANEAGGSYGYWSPNAVAGKAEIQLSYLASKGELVENLEASTDKKILKQLLEDEGPDNEIKKKTTVNKFIDRKIIQF